MDQTDKIVAAILTTGFLKEQVPGGLRNVVDTYEACLEELARRAKERGSKGLNEWLGLLDDTDKRA